MSSGSKISFSYKFIVFIFRPNSSHPFLSEPHSFYFIIPFSLIEPQILFFPSKIQCEWCSREKKKKSMLQTLNSIQNSIFITCIRLLRLVCVFLVSFFFVNRVQISLHLRVEKRLKKIENKLTILVKRNESSYLKICLKYF